MLLCGIIKPHATSEAEAVLGVLQATSVIVKEIKTLLYTPELVEILYDHMSLAARRAIAKELAGNEGIAVLVDAPSIEWFLDIVGRESDPSRCAPHTIRFRFGTHATPATVGTNPWWQNAFHRPIDEREAMRDLCCIFGLRT